MQIKSENWSDTWISFQFENVVLRCPTTRNTGMMEGYVWCGGTWIYPGLILIRSLTLPTARHRLIFVCAKLYVNVPDEQQCIDKLKNYLSFDKDTLVLARVRNHNVVRESRCFNLRAKTIIASVIVAVIYLRLMRKPCPWSSNFLTFFCIL